MNDKKCPIKDDNCFPDWTTYPRKIIAENGNCVENCSLTVNCKYEYEGKCYTSCPKGTTSLFNKNYLCEIFDEQILINENTEEEKMKTETVGKIEITTKERLTENIIEKTTDFINEKNDYVLDRLCKPYGFYKNECLPIKYDSMVAMTKNDIINGLINELLEDVLNENKIDIYKEDDTYKYQITSSFNQKIRKYEKLSIIDLNKCEEELKSKYNINQNETLLIFKYDYIQKDY